MRKGYVDGSTDECLQLGRVASDNAHLDRIAVLQERRHIDYDRCSIRSLAAELPLTLLGAHDNQCAGRHALQDNDGSTVDERLNDYRIEIPWRCNYYRWRSYTPIVAQPLYRAYPLPSDESETAEIDVLIRLASLELKGVDAVDADVDGGARPQTGAMDHRRARTRVGRNQRSWRRPNRCSRLELLARQNFALPLAFDPPSNRLSLFQRGVNPEVSLGSIDNEGDLLAVPTLKPQGGAGLSFMNC
jgi:hypothetical protein